MARLPRSGARREVADHVMKGLTKEGHDNLRAIQPQILVSMDDDTFYWSVLIISIHQDTSGVGIQRKYEEGFEVVEDSNGKFSTKLRVMKPLKKLTVKKSSKKLPLKAHGRKG